MNNMDFLLEYCSKDPELYNKVSNKLWGEFGIQSAEVTLLCTFIVKEFMRKAEEEHND